MSSTHPQQATDTAADKVDDEATGTAAAVDHAAEVAAWRTAERIANDYRPSTDED